jgi:hypothetical protein
MPEKCRKFITPELKEGIMENLNIGYITALEMIMPVFPDAGRASDGVYLPWTLILPNSLCWFRDRRVGFLSNIIHHTVPTFSLSILLFLFKQ